MALIYFQIMSFNQEGSDNMSIPFSRVKNIVIAKIITRFPFLAKRLIEAYKPWESEEIPWSPLTKPLDRCTMALVTTAGVHQKDQTPFDMLDPDGDPTFRTIDNSVSVNNLMITHDYYDHADADKDMNIVFPLERLQEFAQEGVIGRVADKSYSFMGHIDGPYIHTLINKSSPEIVTCLKADKVNVVLLTPG
jgi:D-proline reductase (dithiol) PrdB